MTIVFVLDRTGGFTAGCTETRLTAYAYPSSAHAEKAKRLPDIVAVKMLAAEALTPSTRLYACVREYDALNWRRLEAGSAAAELRLFGAAGHRQARSGDDIAAGTI